jgi:hypothetical protein
MPGAPPTTTGTQHFVTGSGGLLQAFVFGYPGLRIARRGVLSFTAQRPVLPPLGVTRVKLRGLHLLGVDEVRRQLRDLAVLVEKTGGDREREAFALLEARVAAWGRPEGA